MKKMITDPKMLELLVCPITGGTLSLNRKTQELISLKAQLAYPIRDGVPIMLAAEARSLQPNEK
ncbi:Trm112 family protein [Bartonella schoenbuchensis]|uniref:Trm112 family protein n=1 Tax=Bartonella schoenbuchensis TaxID=165694 RepID=UPI0031456A52